MLRTRIVVLLALAAVATAAIAAGCGSSSDDNAAATTESSGAAATTSSGAASGGYGNSASPSTAPSSAAASGPATVKTASGDLGTFLVGTDGRTVYLFEGDTGTTSTCTGACAQNWPPLLTQGAPQASGSAMASLLGTTKRADGSTQVTYNGHPVYYFVQDTAPGTTAGQEVDAFGAEWYVLDPSGKTIEGEGDEG
jgi:predicted lipoprotein with Yx(FWY)xxD motif